MENIMFEEELMYIKNEEVRNQCIEVLKHVHGDFYKNGASSTGKYHPDYAAGEGGLYRHTVAAVRIAQCMRDNTTIHNFSELEFDYIICALILHDTCKCGKNWDSKYTKHGHPLMASELVRETLGEGEFCDNVCPLIESHMGQWTTSKYDKTELPFPETESQMFVHLCDYLASRKFIEINFEKGI